MVRSGHAASPAEWVCGDTTELQCQAWRGGADMGSRDSRGTPGSREPRGGPPGHHFDKKLLCQLDPRPGQAGPSGHPAHVGRGTCAQAVWRCGGALLLLRASPRSVGQREAGPGAGVVSLHAWQKGESAGPLPTLGSPTGLPLAAPTGCWGPSTLTPGCGQVAAF